MARYVMANRRAGKFQESEKQSSRASVGLALSALSSGIDVTRDHNPDDGLARRIVKFDAEPAEIQRMLATLSPDVILEPEILHYKDPLSLFGFPASQANSVVPMDAGTGKTLKVKVVGGGKALKGAAVTLQLSGPGRMSTSLDAETNANGRVTFRYSPFWTPSAIVASPADAFWVTVLLGPDADSTVECQPLPTDGPTEWWHNQVGISSQLKTRGSGIRVGVIDTGVRPNPYLDHTKDIGAFVGVHDPSGGADVGSHGTHVCGTIGARPTKPGDYAGIAPGVALFSARVFPNNTDGAANDDIANAIDALSIEHKCDLINMSLGARVGSAIIRDAIEDALERGTLCICAAGNSSGPVEFPGAFDNSVAVAAIGLLGWGPPGSLPTFRVPQVPDKFGNDNLFLANFSCFGPEIECCAPGVGIIATVPDRHGNKRSYASMGGTSMASPIVCGTAAAVLSKSSAYKQLPRDETRTQTARLLLRQSCRSIGLSPNYEGSGVPTAP